MSALGDVFGPWERKIARDAAALARASVSYGQSAIESGRTDGPFLSFAMRSALNALDTDIASARPRVRALPRATPARNRAIAALGALADGYSDLSASLTKMGTQEGIDAAA